MLNNLVKGQKKGRTVKNDPTYLTSCTYSTYLTSRTYSTYLLRQKHYTFFTTQKVKFPVDKNTYCTFHTFFANKYNKYEKVI
jgi:hypothetical protein